MLHRYNPPTGRGLHPFANEARSPLTLGTVGVNAGVITRKTEPGRVTQGTQPNLTTPVINCVFTQKESSGFFDKYLYPSLRKRVLRYHPSTSGSFMGRATYAASRIFITHDDSGKGKLNTSYFLGMLTSVTVQSAYRPYWARSTSATFNTFGSTIGSDAGINVLHEFGPGIRQILKGHAPKFVSAIGERITRFPEPDGSRLHPVQIMSHRAAHLHCSRNSLRRGLDCSSGPHLIA